MAKPRTVLIELGEATTGNGVGPIIYDAVSDMRIFDDLPREVRSLMSEAAYNYSAEQMSSLFRRHGGCSAEETKFFCANMGYGYSENIGVEAFRMYGPDHPQANIGGKRKLVVHPNSLLAALCSPQLTANLTMKDLPHVG